jgi:hypothetical protein
MNAKLDPPEGGLERISIVKTQKMEEINQAIKLSLALL